MNKLFGPFFWAVFLPSLAVFAQNGSETFPDGARSVGLANAHTTLDDAWSVFNNIGALGMLQKSSVFCSYDHRLGLNELTTLAAGGVVPTPIGNLGISLSHYGGQLFNQQVLGAGFSNKFGIGSFGIKASYFQTNIEGYGRSASPVFELGGLVELGPKVFWGAHIYNFTRAKISNNTEDYLPTIVKSGISYRPNEKLLVNVEAEKDILLDPLMKIGLEYNFTNRFWARCGIRTNPSNLHFGIGFHPKNISLDYAVAQNSQLGLTHHFSMNYSFGTP
ncbi:hypothetical protein [Echinicola sp. 20G]|uniref:hypothetical protein n=1 Tax=Echinicola sp. 20G TaxID=2781961 RepID=UPI001910BDEF|nr:hypothetical protein [Echinicola sp. 20G]